MEDYFIFNEKVSIIVMMDDAIYAGKAFSKLRTYSRHGIIPSINLITTYETGNNPLNLDAVQKIIEQYFL